MQNTFAILFFVSVGSMLGLNLINYDKFKRLPAERDPESPMDVPKLWDANELHRRIKNLARANLVLLITTVIFFGLVYQ